jgi:hypothetical protein
LPYLQHEGRAVVLAEECHTVHVVLHLDWLLRQARVRSQGTILWNANGLGGYTSGTIAGVPTRRYHGLLIAALPAPLGRMVMFRHLREQLRFLDVTGVKIRGAEHAEHDLEMLEIFGLVLISTSVSNPYAVMYKCCRRLTLQRHLSASTKFAHVK